MNATSANALEAQFVELLERNHGALRRLVGSYTRGDERDDLMQEIAMSLWRALPGFRQECSLRTFLFRIAHNRCITHTTRRRNNVSIDESEMEISDPGADTEAAIASGEESARLQAAVRRLPVTYREVVVLMLEGLDYREIAEVVGISESNVGVRLNRARQRLKNLLEEKR
jgi:RNA polymerase sigma factor (sigma-70 family)